MKKIAIKTLILFVFFATTAAVSAQVNTLYYMKTVSTRHELNPAFQSYPNVYVQLPIISGIYFAGGNNSLILNDAIYPKFGSTVTFLHPEYNDKDRVYNQLRKDTRIFSEAQIDWLGFGFRTKEKNFFTFGFSTKASASTTIPKDIFKLGLYGTPDTINMNVFDFKNLNVNANIYTEIAVGYSRNIDEKLTVGGKAKFLLGQANVSMKSEKLTLETSREKWIAHMNSEINVSAPYTDYYINDEAKLDSLSFNEPNKSSDYFKLLTKPNGYGGALDLGVSYYILDNHLHLSAAALDLGFIQWTKKTAKMKANGDFEFEGTTIELDDDNKIDWGSLEDEFKHFEDSIQYKTTLGNSYGAWLPAKVMLGVEYGILDNKITFGVLSRTTIVNQKLYEELTTSVNYLPAKWFNASVSYSWMNGRFNNIGLGLGGRVGPVNLYVATDYGPMRYTPEWYPTHTQQINFKTGIILNFGYREDDDKDGVVNRKDLCPDTPRGVKVDKHGCPIDSDGDGVPDYLDECPDTPPEAWGTVDERGCPKDSDGDGVPDYLDKCPGTPPGVEVDEHGCPKIQPTVMKLFEKAMQGIQFETGKAVIRTSSYSILDEIVKVMNEHSYYMLKIDGHTDNVGNPASNQVLSEKRANSVKDYMVKKGISENRMTTQGFGDTKPMVPNTTTANKALNRRVEFMIVFEQEVPAGP
jgi:outer membrane protein OmpA-like peptidoglycan-associated protein